MMNIFNWGRQKGKTYKLLLLAEFSNGVVVCATQREKAYLRSVCAGKGYTGIVDRIYTVDEFKKTTTALGPPVFIDNVDTVLSSLFGNVHTITLTGARVWREHEL